MSRAIHALEAGDILSVEEYERVRDDRRAAMIARKRRRRLAVGPDITFYFENYDTMWMQVHEMLRAEGGGAAQLEDELAAFNPLIPKGRELVVTMMIEIADEGRRRATLAGLGGIENRIAIRIGEQQLAATAEGDVERTTAGGRTSSVHFLHFPFTSNQIAGFRDPAVTVLLAVDHPGYGHMAVLPSPLREELAADFE